MNKKIINDIVSIIAIILLITSCLSKKIKEIEDIQLKKLCEISAKNMDSLKSINLFSSDDKGNLYIYDDINKRVVVFDSKGNYTYQFGRSGSGPGEFKNVFSIITTTSCILIIDISKYVIIKYNYIGQFMSEKKIPLIGIPKAISYEDIILGWHEIPFKEGKKIMRQRGIGIFSYSLLLKKDIYSVKDVYNPYIFDPNLASSVFSLNRLNGEIAVSEIDSREFKVHIFNKNYELIKTIIIDLPPIKYAKKTFNGIQEFYDKQCDIMNKQYGKKYEVKKLNKYTRLVKDIAYDKDSNLWVLTPQDKNPDKVRIIIFDKNYKLKGVFHPLLPLGKMYIRNNNLIYFSGIEAEDRKLEIYKIVRK